MPEGTKLTLLAPVVVNRKGEHLDMVEEFRSQGFVRLRVDGKVIEIDAFPKLDKMKKHTIEVVVDRLKISADGAAGSHQALKQRLAESFETCLRSG